MTGPGCGRTVLIVEDDADTRQALAEVLQDVNYRPLHAADGVAALHELRTATTAPCVILLDVMMPIMDGRTFRAEQQKDPALSEIPVVVLSAHADLDSAAEQMQAAGFLRKPVELTALLATVARFCAQEPETSSDPAPAKTS
jgi:two-component system, chemotaxis family, chemotaxis protein CheY